MVKRKDKRKHNSAQLSQEPGDWSGRGNWDEGHDRGDGTAWPVQPTWPSFDRRGTGGRTLPPHPPTRT